MSDSMLQSSVGTMLRGGSALLRSKATAVRTASRSIANASLARPGVPGRPMASTPSTPSVLPGRKLSTSATSSSSSSVLAPGAAFLRGHTSFRPFVQPMMQRNSRLMQQRTMAAASGGSEGGSGRRINQKDFTDKAWQAIIAAPEIATSYGNQIVETEHLTKALLEQPNGLARRIVAKAGSDPTRLLDATDAFIRRQPRVSGDAGQVLGRNLEAVVNAAMELRTAMGDQFVSVEHLLLALADDDRFGRALLQAEGLDRGVLRGAVDDVRGSNKVTDQDPEGKYEALSKYARDLTQAARDGKLDPVIGRDEEVRRAIQILSRRTKNNPVLIGEPGVGKTAVVEGLAQRIVKGDVPSALLDRTLMALDMGSLIAGAKYRGEFEDRLKAVVKEVVDSNGRIILFIDEIHTIVGAGATDGAMDASNLLKPMLSRGELRCIGATTLDEYRKYIEKDAALERRFQQVLVKEPSVAESISILRGLRERYEIHHGVRIADSALVEAAVLSDRYIQDRFLPDKAIDLVDESAARLKMEMTSKPSALDEIDRRVLQLEMEKVSLAKEAATDRASQSRLQALEGQLARLKAEQGELTARWEVEKGEMDSLRGLKEEIGRVELEISQAERDYDLNRAAELKYGTLPNLRQKLAEAEGQLMAMPDGGRMLREEVTEDDIAEVVAKWTGIPVNKLVTSERERLLRLSDELHRRVVGQEDAVDAVADAIQRSRAGMSDPNRPIASFMFLGPTGVGKTELAKALAESMFNTESAMVRLDMSEYMEKHSVSRLIGAPPGYVGYEEGGQLTEAVRRRPYAVILFDEVEKAHADVFNVLLQILDDGRVTDSQGRVVNFKNAVLIMTSNIGSHVILDKMSRDPDSVKEEVTQQVRQHFRPEFINRIDEFIVFSGLSLDEIKNVVRLQVARVQQRLDPRKIRLTLTENAYNFLATRGFDPAFGARPVKRVVQRELETVLAKAILRGDINDEDEVLVDAPGGGAATQLDVTVRGSNGGISQQRVGAPGTEVELFP